MNKGSILHLIPNANLGGIEKDLFHILDQEDGKYNHEVWVYGQEGPMSNEWQNKGATVSHLDILDQNPLDFLKRLKNKAKLWLGQGVMCWSPIRLPMVGHAFTHFTGATMVHLGNPVNNSLKTQYWNLLCNKLLSSHTTIKLFCCSQFVLESIKEDIYFKGFDVTVSHNPVKIPENNPYTLKQWELPTIGMLARMDKIKDFDTVIKSMEYLPNSLQLHLGGDGGEKKRLEALVQELGIENVLFLGFVTETYKQLRQWKMFVYGTTMLEGLGNVVIEAMANGLPCILPDLPMMKEIGGDCAVYYEQGNEQECAKAILQLMNDETKALQLSEKAYLRAKDKFHPAQYYKERMNYLIQGN